jgi:hypothetical protein
MSKLYITDGAAPYTPATIRGSWDRTTDLSGSSTTPPYELSESREGAGDLIFKNYIETVNNTEYDVLMVRAVSGPLAAQTISGTVDLCFPIWNYIGGGHLYWHVHIYVTQGDSDTVRGTLLSDYRENSEPGNPGPDQNHENEVPSDADPGTGPIALAFKSAQSVSSVACSSGDRIVVEIGVSARNSQGGVGAPQWRFGWGTIANGHEVTVGETGYPIFGGVGFLNFSHSIDFNDSELRVSQDPVEVITSDPGDIRVTQMPVEVIHSNTGDIRVTQLPVEVVRKMEPPPIRVTQMPVELVVAPIAPEIMATQFVVEVVGKNLFPDDDAATVWVNLL